MPQTSEILPKQQQTNRKEHTTPKTGEISPKETHQVIDLEAIEEGAVARTPNEGTRGNNQAHPQHMSTREHDTEGAQSRF